MLCLLRADSLLKLLDSDSRIPQDCFLDAATEMELSPAVGIRELPQYSRLHPADSRQCNMSTVLS